MKRLKLKDGNIIQTSDKYSGSKVMVGCTRDGEHIYKAKIQANIDIEQWEWKEIAPKITPSGYAKGESHTHEKTKYLKLSVPNGGLKAVHQLVASCWLKEPDDGNEYHVHHKNHHQYENNAENLEYVTPQQHVEIHLKGKKHITKKESEFKEPQNKKENKMFIIQQEDIVKTFIPIKYRGMNPETGKYGELKEKLEDTIPFPSTKESINEINKLINTMRKTGREGIHPDNSNKKFTILEVDDDYIIRKQYSLKDWFNNSVNKLEW